MKNTTRDLDTTAARRVSFPSTPSLPNMILGVDGRHITDATSVKSTTATLDST